MVIAIALSAGMQVIDEHRLQRAVLGGLVNYESSIHSLQQRWESTSPRVPGMQQQVWSAGRSGFDDMGTAFDSVDYRFVDAEGAEQEYSTRERAQGGISHAWQPGAAVGMLRPSEGLVGGGALNATIFRAIDNGGGLRLSEAMLRSKEVKIRSVSGTGTVVLEAVLDLDSAWYRATVAIDTQHGFAPSFIQLQDALGTLRVEVAEMSDFRLHDGVWIAHRVTSRGFKYPREAELTDEKLATRQAFEAALKRELGGRAITPRDPAVFAAFDRAKAQVLGDGLLPERPIRPDSTLTFEVESINAPIDFDSGLRIPKDVGFFDSFHNLNTDGEVAFDPTEGERVRPVEREEPDVIVTANKLAEFRPIDAGGCASSPDTVVTVCYRVQNTASVPLQISCPERSCGCLSVEWDQGLLNPGDSTSLRLSLNTGGVANQQSATLRLSGPEVSAGGAALVDEVRLDVVIPEGGPFSIVPGLSYPMLIVAVEGMPFEAAVSLVQTGAAPIVVTKAETTVPFAVVDGPVTSPKNPFVQQLVLRGFASEPGFSRGWVNFETTAEAQPRGQARFFIRVLPAWKASPNGFAIGPSTPPGSVHEVTLTRRSPTARSIVSSRWRGDAPPSVSVAVRIVDPETVTIVLNDPTGELREDVGSHSIELLDEAGGVVVELPVTWCSLEALRRYSDATPR